MLGNYDKAGNASWFWSAQVVNEKYDVLWYFVQKYDGFGHMMYRVVIKIFFYVMCQKW